jgi:hypothetical protein
MLGIVGCGRGYEDANRSIIAELPNLEGVELVTEHHSGYCSTDTCLLGSDRSSALLTFTVDTDLYTPETLIAAYHDQLPDWEQVSADQGCIMDTSACDDLVSVTFARDQERININLDNWPVGQFDIGADAQGGLMDRS